ncbi:MAG: HAMP domain-containing protein [Kouleothrix sp.]
MSLLLAHRALNPLDRMTRTAQQISAENFSRRLDLRGPDDEVGRLARTFDAVTRLQAAFDQQRRFTADASHELRTPLTAMIGQIDVAVDRPRAAESYRDTLLSVREQATPGAYDQRPAVSGAIRCAAGWCSTSRSTWASCCRRSSRRPSHSRRRVIRR